MARVRSDGLIQMRDGRILGPFDPITMSDYIELAQIISSINPSLAAPFPGLFRGGSGGGFVASGGGGQSSPAALGVVGAPRETVSQDPHSLYAETTLSDTTPVNPPLVYDGNSVSEIPIPSGYLAITDLYFGLGFVYWTIEVNRGSGFTSLATFGFTLLSPPVTEKKEFKFPIIIPGGTGVVMRLKVAAAVSPLVPIEVKATLRCYTNSGAPPNASVLTLTDLTTKSASEEILNLSENGGTPASSIEVPAGTVLDIGDYDVASGGAPGSFKLQQTKDGLTWFTIGVLEVFGVGMGTSLTADPRTPWKIKGSDGPAVAIRLAVTTSAGATPVAAVLSAQRG